MKTESQTILKLAILEWKKGFKEDQNFNVKARNKKHPT